MAANLAKPNVGSTGRRRIVPMMGIDFIAGNIENKKGPVRAEYGVKPASIGGRTRKWSFINFMQCNPSGKRAIDESADAVARRTNFAIATKSALATSRDLAVLPRAQADYKNGTIYNGNINPYDYATFRGWLTRIRYEQILASIRIEPTTTTWPPEFEVG